MKLKWLSLMAVLFGIFSTPAFAINPQYPIKVSSNGRYLVDQNNIPFMLIGDSSQTAIRYLTASQISSYFATRHSQGFNASWQWMFCVYSQIGQGAICPPNNTSDSFTAQDGTHAFTGTVSGGYPDLGTPNEAYWIGGDH